MFILNFIARVLVIIGALNWGSIGVFNFNFVSFILGWPATTTYMGVERIIYIIVGLAGLYAIKFLCTHCCCKHCKNCPCSCHKKGDSCCSKDKDQYNRKD